MNDNYFTETLLPIHIKLQGLYRKRCGEWRIKDEYTVTGNVIHRINNHHDLQNVMDTPELCKMIPRTIDDSSLEAQRRSLWEMLRGTKTLYDYLDIEQGLGIQGDIGIGVSLSGGYKYFKGSSSTEVILRALCAQEGIEP